jgi:CRP/FNR family transcriptional regulator
MFDSFFVHEDEGLVQLVLRGQGTIFPLYYSFRSTSLDQVLQVIALTDSELIVIPKDELLDLMLEMPFIAIAMLDAYGKFASYLDYVLVSRLYDSVRIRVCGFLLLHSNGDSTIKLTHDQIAKAVGSSRAKVSEVISELKKESLIEARRGCIKVLDLEELSRRSSYIARIEE